MELKGSKTEKNLWEAFAGESQARIKYDFYASKARKDGYEEIGNIFAETSGNEKEHAKVWFKLLHGGSVPDTLSNLFDAAAGEHGEWTDMYDRMAKDAKAEGFHDIAYKFAEIGKIEKFHEERYLKLAEEVKAGKIFTRKKETAWFCLNCGHIHTSKDAPEKCPVCDHPKSFFVEMK